MNEQAMVPYTALVGWGLKTSRQRCGLSQAAVASRLGITQSAWAKIEKGVVPINVIQLAQFSDIVGEDVSDIFRGVEHAAAMVQGRGTDVVFERVESRADSGNLILGAALAGLLALLFTEK